MKDIEIKITPEEVNLIMEGLGNLTFVRVYQLIGKIQDQAGAQLQQTNGQAPQEPVVTEKP